MILLLKLLLAHMIGDFFLQPMSWIEEKNAKKFASVRLYLHALMHGILTMLFVWDIHFWKPALIIVISHAVFDGLKVTFQREKNMRTWFVMDQLLHLIVIIIIWYFWMDYSISLNDLFSEYRLLLITAVVAVTYPSSVMIKIIISRWTPHTEDSDDQSLQDAGRYIGILERLFVLAFVLTGHWEAVGFLIAAKSVFRFGDLKESKDRKLTEYILIGTLLSFGLAILVGMTVQMVIFD